MTEASPSLHALNAAYHPFPPFERWLAGTTVDEGRWSRYLRDITNLTRRLDASVLRRAYEIVKRAAAIDTGAIEGLYEVDRGFTFTVAMEAALWESALAEKGDHVRPLFEAQLHAYNYILDLATKAEPLSEAAIRALHAEICHAQETYPVVTAVGPQEHSLPKGVYKTLPNHVRTREGTDHSYAPVDVTPAEITRLVGELRSDAFLAAHPIIQAAYAHYALVVIHPFADGNGRVARALASAFTYRAISMPIVILNDHKPMYLDSLEAADQGGYQVFVGFMLDRSLETIKLVEENLRSAVLPSVEEAVASIQRLYVTRGGYTVEQIDAAGASVVDLLAGELQQLSQRLVMRPIVVKISIDQISYEQMSSRTSREGYREPLDGGRAVSISLATPPPADADFRECYWVEIPKDAAGNDDIVLTNGGNDTFTARVDELVPTPTGMLRARIGIFAERIVRKMLAKLSAEAERILRQHGG